MNLKEAFRYQNFLDAMMERAQDSVSTGEHAYQVTKKHLKKAANPNAEDLIETVEPIEPFVPNDDTIRFMLWLTEERGRLTTAIDNTKKALDCDIDAAIEQNKFRQRAANGIKSMLYHKPTKGKEIGTDYMINGEGNQVPYKYTIEVERQEAFDRERAKDVVRNLLAEADAISTLIDSTMINSEVEYETGLNPSDEYDDVLAWFLANS